tara:strand:- start:887 stop:1807 length:921 start_codon:yes stop_codon:yes gene_type:complete
MPQDYVNLPAAIAPASAVETYRTSTNAADLCGSIVKATAKDIQGRKYVCVEGWQAIAIAHGCAATSCGVERIEGGVRAIGQVRRMDTGTVIAEAEGFVGEDEPVWFGGEGISFGKRKTYQKRPDFAIRAMAQTRAISRACRSAFAHVVVLIDKDLGTTPAEEMMGVIDHEASEIAPTPQKHRPGPAGSASAGIDFLPPGPRRTGWAKEAENDGLIDENRQKGKLPAAKGDAAPTNTPKATGNAVKRLEWVKESVAFLRQDGTDEHIARDWWIENKARVDIIETAMPTEYERLLDSYNEALERKVDA